ncbi:MAG TPA: ABC transporter permease subunit [Vicinamibacteria bacterium]|nr:ABC transporter permease subunit [Vicinamibacteria bacterium]
MSAVQSSGARRVGPAAGASPIWWLVFKRELGELWLGGKALYLMLVYTVLMGLYAWSLATNTELNLLPLKEMVFEMVKAAIAVSLFICLIVGAESVSGERERLTLEGLLLTPASRGELLVGKFLAAASPWPVALAIAFPYWRAVSQGDAVFERAALWGAVVGSILAPAFAGLGMLISVLCNTNKASMVASLAFYLVFLLPTTLAGPPKIQRSAALWLKQYLLEWVNPMASSNRFLQRVLIDNWPAADVGILLTMPVVFLCLTVVLLVQHGAPALRLEAGVAERVRPYWAWVAGLWHSTAGFASRSPSRG